MTLKMHIGFFILLTMTIQLMWVADDKLKNNFKWYLPILASVIITAILEAYLWTVLFFFVY